MSYSPEYGGSHVNWMSSGEREGDREGGKGGGRDIFFSFGWKHLLSWF